MLYCCFALFVGKATSLSLLGQSKRSVTTPNLFWRCPSDLPSSLHADVSQHLNGPKLVDTWDCNPLIRSVDLQGPTVFGSNTDPSMANRAHTGRCKFIFYMLRPSPVVEYVLDDGIGNSMVQLSSDRCWHPSVQHGDLDCLGQAELLRRTPHLAHR